MCAFFWEAGPLFPLSLEKTRERQRLRDKTTDITNFHAPLSLSFFLQTLSKLLKFSSTVSGASSTTTLSEYVSRMKEGQDAIYFVAADSVEKGEKSPFVEALIKRDYEVIESIIHVNFKCFVVHF